jgi:hypothetical protein
MYIFIHSGAAEEEESEDSSLSSAAAIPAQQSSSWYIEGYKNMILDEANRLYYKLLKHFTNSIIDNAIGASSSSNSS